jgi:rhodanese-related sulfurtransferase
MKKLAVLAASLLLAACSREIPFNEVSIDKVRAAVESRKAILVDLRNKEDRAADMIPIAAAITLEEIEKGTFYAPSLPGGLPVYVLGESREQAQKGAVALKKRGREASPLRESAADLLRQGFGPAQRYGTPDER